MFITFREQDIILVQMCSRNEIGLTLHLSHSEHAGVILHEPVIRIVQSL